MEKKYQVFVSSTYKDLIEERQEVIHALLELDCIPSGMELFPAADEDQWSLIQGVIDECDYYIVIIGGRYGSLDSDGMGYTEKEYRYALEKEKPIIAFLHKDPDSLPKKDTEKSEEGQKNLSDFRKLAQKKMCKYWETPQELGSVVSRSLIMLQKKHPGTGWVRGDLVPDQEATKEILTLKKQIEQLQAKLNEASTLPPPGTERLAQGEDTFEIRYNCKSRIDGEYTLLSVTPSYVWKEKLTLNWNDIFREISPLLIHEAGEYQMQQSIRDLVEKREIPELKKNEEAENHEFFSFSISDDDFQTIKVQLRALGLISQSVRNRSVKDNETYWKLTPYGDSIMNQLRAIRREDDK